MIKLHELFIQTFGIKTNESSNCHDRKTNAILASSLVTCAWAT